MIKKGLPQKPGDMKKTGKLEELEDEEKIGMAAPEIVKTEHGEETKDGLDMVK